MDATISDAEWRVMEAAWSLGEAPAAAITEELAKSTAWNHRTIRTLLGRLVEKGVLEKQGQGAGSVYRALVPRRARVRSEGWSFLNRIFHGDTTSLLLHFAKEAKLAPANLANVVPAVGLLLVLVLILAPWIPFEPQWFNVTMSSASHKFEETEVNHLAVAEIRWSPDSERLLTRSHGGRIGSGALSFCDLAPDATARPRWSGIRDTCHAVLSCDGSTAFFSTHMGQVFCMQLNSVETQEMIKLPAGERVCGVATAPDGRLLALGSIEGTILLTDVDGVESGRLSRGDDKAASCIAFSADGRRLLSTSPFCSIVVWDVTQRLRLQKLTAHDRSQTEAVFLDDGRQILSGDEDGMLRQWDVATGAEVWRGGVPGVLPVLSLTVDPREMLAVIAEGDGRIALWDLTTKELLDDPQAHAGLATRVRFSPDGMSLASAGTDGMIRIWDVATRTIKMEIDLRQAQ